MIYEKLIQNVEKLSSQKGVNKTTALIESGVGKNFIYNISKGSDPSIEKVQQLADYFDVSVDYLLGRDPKDVPALSSKQRKVLELYESLSPEQQESFEHLLDSVLGLKK